MSSGFKDEITIKNMRLINGEALKVMDKLIEQGIVVDAIITDPPYGTTQNKWDSVIPFDKMWKRLNKLIKPNGAIVLFGSEPFSSALRMSNIKNYKYDWIWEKQQGTGHLNAKKQPLRKTELISVFYKKQCTYNPQMKGNEERVIRRSGKYSKTSNYNKFIEIKESKYKGRYPINIIKINTPKAGLHPTQKPVPLMEYLIKTYTNESELVLDFTAGSFTTAIACLNTKRKFIGIELDENYFKIGTDRVKQHLESQKSS